MCFLLYKKYFYSDALTYNFLVMYFFLIKKSSFSNMFNNFILYSEKKTPKPQKHILDIVTYIFHKIVLMKDVENKSEEII